jgi:hypothetical protein
MKLRDYQIEISKDIATKLSDLNIAYVVAEVRTGKTLMALEACKINNYKNVLFITKKRAIDSIQSDYKALNYNYELTVINDESLHKIAGNFDVVIHDEHHRFGAFPKPNVTAKLFKKMFGHLPMIFLSGTPAPESNSQWYHQFWVSKFSPFEEPNFYKWAHNFVNIKKRHLGYAEVNDYSDANFAKIMPIINPYLIRFSQENAGFETTVNETVLYCDMLPSTHTLCNLLIKNLVIQGKDEVILADTAVKLQGKLHQMYSGTVKFESGNSKILDLSKAEFIKEHFKGKKIAIFYKFKEEWNALFKVFGENLTNELSYFNNSDKNIALQIQSGKEGISLKEADYLIYYNIDFSAASYWQSRDRLSTLERKTNDVYWVFAHGGIEDRIYKAVQNKKDYTLKLFKKDFGINNNFKGLDMFEKYGATSIQMGKRIYNLK